MPRKKKEEIVAEKMFYEDVFNYLLANKDNENYYSMASNYLKSNNLIRDYIPYEMRKDIAKEIVNAACYKDGEFTIDSSYMHALSCATELVLYLNVEWPEDINYMSVYDMYELLGFNALLKIDYYSGLLYMCDSIVGDIQVNELSVPAQLHHFLLKLNNEMNVNVSDVVNNPDFIALLSNKLINDAKEE